MSGGPKKKVSAAAARTYTRNSKPVSSYGVSNKLVLVVFVLFAAYVYQSTIPPPPKPLGPPDGLPITSPRIKLRDGRHLAYRETGVPKETAKSKLVFIHGFGDSKYFHPFADVVSPAVIEELGVYVVAIDRPGYGESDPDPKRTVKSLAFDIEELADQLKLGPNFYVAGWSMGGQVIWSCLKYIPDRLAGAILIAPAVNFWWPNLPSNLTKEAFSQQLKQDQWAYRVAHYLPWLTYWWNTQKWFPYFSVIDGNVQFLSPPDVEALTKQLAGMTPNQLQVLGSLPRQQGEFESLHRDMNIGFGKWDFDPIDLDNPFPNNDVGVHLWVGDQDWIVPVTLQRYIAQQLGWVTFHELAGTGHMLPFNDGVTDTILKTLLNAKN